MEVTLLDLATEVLEWWDTEKDFAQLELYGDEYDRYGYRGEDIPTHVKLAAKVVGLEL